MGCYDSTHADRDSQACGFCTNRGVRNRRADPFSNGAEIVWEAIGKYRKKFLSSVAPQEIVRAHSLTNTMCDSLQYGIATQMAIGVIERLETVEVHHQYSRRRPRASPSLQFMI